MFGRSPDKKKIGTTTHQVVEPIAQPKDTATVNIIGEQFNIK